MHTCNASQNNNLCSFAKKTIVFVMFMFVSKCCNLKKNKIIIKPKTKEAKKKKKQHDNLFGTFLFYADESLDNSNFRGP